MHNIFNEEHAAQICITYSEVSVYLFQYLNSVQVLCIFLCVTKLLKTLFIARKL